MKFISFETCCSLVTIKTEIQGRQDLKKEVVEGFAEALGQCGEGLGRAEVRYSDP